jgi:microcystin degradation protein MlrC
MRIAIGGFFHESNTFNPIITGKEDFVIFYGEEIYKNRNAYLLAKGIIEYFEPKSEYEMVPLVFAKAVPNGEINKELYLSLKRRFFEMLEQTGPIDAFVLALHGSMRVYQIGSAETDLLNAIREKYPQVPIYAGLDMHATMTEDMLKTAEAYVGFKTAPHIDAYETGYAIAELCDYSFKNNCRLVMKYAKIDALIAGEKSETDCEPMKSLINELYKCEPDEDVLSASYLLGFPWADALENGVTALVVGKSNPDKIQKYADLLAEKFRENQDRFDFSSPAYDSETALRMALQETVYPVFVSDSGDNPTAGSTADNTEIIGILSSKLQDECRGKKILCAGIFDAEAVKICTENPGKKINLEVGGKFDNFNCRPVKLNGVPVKIYHGFGMLKTTLVLFKTDEFELILVSKHIGFTNAEMFKALEIDYLNYNIIIPKLGYLTEDFKEISAKSYLALSKGCTDEVLSRLKYSKPYKLI